MSNISRQYRSTPKFYQSQVSQVLPEFFVDEYPKLVLFLEKYYESTGEETNTSITEQIHNLFDVRNISNTELSYLDQLIGEISDGLETSSFYQSPRLMARLLADLYRAKGTAISTEQFFKAFYGENVEIKIIDLSGKVVRTYNKTEKNKIIIEAIAETTNPLYSAFITFLSFPSLTKNVPKIEVKIQAPPIVSG